MKKRLLVLLTLLGLMFVLAGCSRLASEYEPGKLRDYRNSQEYGMVGADDSSSNEAAKNKQVFAPDHDRQNAEQPMENRSDEPEGDETRYIEETVAPAETEPDMHALNAEEVTEEETASEQTMPAAENTAAQAANTPGNQPGTPSGTPSGNTNPVSGGNGSGSTTPPNNSTTPTNGTEPSSEEPSSEETTTEPETTTLPAGDGIPIDESHFPDPAFRSYLMTISGLEDGYLSDEDIAGVNYLFFNDLEISSLDGIGYFSDLTYFDASGNNISSLDLSTNYNLDGFNVAYNCLDSLDVTNCNRLVTLNCAGNNIRHLDVSENPDLRQLECSDNYLSELYLGNNTNLEDLRCGNNCITELDLSSNQALYWLQCEENQISHIDLSNNQELIDVNLYHNPMTSLTLDSHPESFASHIRSGSVVHTSISPENFNILDFDPYFDLSRIHDYPSSVYSVNSIIFDENGNISSTVANVSDITEMSYRYLYLIGSPITLEVTIYFD